ncbi:protein of unknown function [Candidatus Methylocalor cossyra]|uniref:Uncharacterized protein n=1 Tax=Candidatus Methylocalor cossyra TaxID=3108543 RepID=A0ABM9NI49_9GAMM
MRSSWPWFASHRRVSCKSMADSPCGGDPRRPVPALARGVPVGTGAILVYALAAAESFASAPVAIKPRDPLAKCKFFKNKAKSARSGPGVKLSEGSTH